MGKTDPKVRCSYTKLWKLKDLIPHPDNPNKHPQKQVDMLAYAMRQNGIRAPITVSKLSGFITRGHCRLLAAEKLGLKTYPVDEQVYKTEAEEYQDLVADNAIAELAEFDIGIVNKSFAKFGPDLDLKAIGIVDFKIEPAELGGKKKDKKKEDDKDTGGRVIECPSCGHQFS